MTDQDNQQNNRRAPVRPPIDPLDHLPSDNPTMNNQAPVQGNINTAEAQHNNDGDVVQHVPPIARLDQDVVSGQNQAQSGSVSDGILDNILWAAFEQDLAQPGNGHDSVDPPHDQSFWRQSEALLEQDLGSEHMGNEMPPPSQPSMPTQFSYNPAPAQYNPTANQYNSAADQYNPFQPYETSNNPFDSHPLNGFNQNNLPAQSNASGGMPASSHYSGFGTNSQSQHFPNLNEAGSAQRRFGFAEENPWAAEMNRMSQFNAQNSATREAEQRNLPGQNAFYDHRPHQPQGYGLQQNNLTQSYGIPIHDTHAAATVVTPVSRNTRKSLSSGNSNKKGPGPDNSSDSKGSGQRNSTSKVGGNAATPSKTGGTNSTPASNEHSSRKRARRTGSGGSQTESSTPIKQPNSAPNVGTAHNNGLPNYLSRRAISRAANPVGDRITPAKDLQAELAKKDDTKKRLAQDKVDRINERKDDVALARSLYKIKCPEYAAEIARIAEEQIARIHARYEDTEEYVKEKTARSRS
ncbi:hypothetical protein D6D13_06684 [Aureobasidium pullulans]|uniref:Uncharacterized protein n=1 Tax=Aureobasidium pullulans TaxID=5580 RepID=A0A4S9CGI7_AURPU|nr:hypothetical protein D6D13_06684 [Aureobasidium pullulans]